VTALRSSRRQFLALSSAAAASASLPAWGSLIESPFRKGTNGLGVQTPPGSYDLVIVGATPAGIMAARQASAKGAKVCVIENLMHVGGMLGPGGLCVTDSEVYSRMGGLTAQYFTDVATYYKNPKGVTSLYAWEPSAAMSIFGRYLESPSITVMLGRTIGKVSKTGSRVTAILLDNSETIRGNQWIDASYEGDLMALAGVKYMVGRESYWTYGESLAGYQVTEGFPYPPYSSGSTLLPFVNPPSDVALGSADNKIMANFWRATLSLNPANSVPFPQPANYDRDLCAGILEYILLDNLTSHRYLWSSGFLPNNSYCMEAYGLFTDQVGFGGWGYPDADWPARRAMIAYSRFYQQNWMYFCANDPAVPSDVRANVKTFGLAKNQFTDNGNWPYLLYLREGRRMVGKYVMTQNDTGNGNNQTKADSIGLGQWPIDCHACDLNAEVVNGDQGITVDGFLEGESLVPYELSFQSMQPNEVSNLLVPVCLSASHVAFSAIRTEPSYMILGEAAGAAVVQVLGRGVDVLETNIPALQATLTAGGSILYL